MLFLMVFVGGLSGFLSGLLGIGGGIVMVPLLFWLLPYWGLSQDVAVPVALGTSLASAACFTFSGALGHWKRGVIDWRRVPWLIMGGVLGAMTGSTLATWLGGVVVKKAFAFLLLFAFYRMAFSPLSKKEGTPARERRGLPFFVIGLATGLVGSFFGVGGGIVAIPFMVLVYSFPTLEAVATSSAIIPAIAGAGALAYVFHGWGKAGLPPYSLGYVSLLLWGLLVAGGLLASQGGVWVGHKVGGTSLRRAFSVLLLFMAIKLFIG
jgi:uncharacterized membrane protein YfcA